MRAKQPNALRAINLPPCDEGIDTDRLGPDPQAQFTLPDGPRLKAGEPIITYVARNLEPYRGIHHFLRALAIVQQRHPTCHALIVGGDDVSYGQRPKDAANWREKLTRDIALDPTRTHFIGKLPYDAYRRVLQVSAAHVYLSYPFVLSWSMLEAMASGCLVIGSDTAPVREVLRHGENGWRVDFFDDEAIAGRIVEVLNDPPAQEPLRRQARADMVAGYSLQQGLAGYERLLGIARVAGARPVAEIVSSPEQLSSPQRNQRQTLIGCKPLWRQIA